MAMWRWRIHLLARSLSYRRGRTLLLLAILAMASSLATSLGIVSTCMERRVAEEVRRFGANLVITPENSRVTVGSGGLNFGLIGEPAYLERRLVEDALQRSGLAADSSMHLAGTLRLGRSDLPAEGVDFAAIRGLFPWWQIRGAWPGEGDALVGSTVAVRERIAIGSTVALAGVAGTEQVKVAGILTTGGEEDGIVYLPLGTMQRLIGEPGRVTMVRLLVGVGGDRLNEARQRLTRLIPGGVIREVRQVARSSEALLAKVKLLMAMVTVVVLISAGSSVAGTMGSTVLERSREIGLMKAMGGSRRGVMLLFGGEAILLGLAGGGVGYLLGSGIAAFVMHRVFAAPPELLPAFLPISIGVGLLLSMAGSAGPLVSVFRLDPVVSLRGE